MKKSVLALMGLFLCLNSHADGTVTLARPDGTMYGTLNNGIPVSLSGLLWGEDQTNSVMKTEQQFSFAHDDADLVVKSSAGFLHSVSCYGEDAAAEAGRVRVTNTTTAGGAETTEVWGAEFAASLQGPINSGPLDIVMTTGITLDFTTTTDVKCTVSYR